MRIANVPPFLEADEKTFAASNISFLPIVLLALVFNVTNVVGFTYADRDSKRKWATGMAASSMFGSIGGVGGSIVSGLGTSHFTSILVVGKMTLTESRTLYRIRSSRRYIQSSRIGLPERLIKKES